VRLAVDLPPPGSLAFDVAGVGLNTTDLLACVDRFPEPDSKLPLRRLERRPGGQTATALVACARLGWKARYIGRFGDDENGVLGRASLEREGVDTSAAVTVPQTPNALSIILVDASAATRTVMWTRAPGLKMQPNDVPESAVRTARVLLVDCHETAAVTHAARCARAAGIPTVIDVEHVRPGIEDLLEAIDIVIAAKVFPAALTGEPTLGRAVRAIHERFRPALVCVTLGEEGSLAYAAGREIRTPAFRVPVADTTGAGDVFRGGFIAGWLAAGRNGQLADILRYANAVAALACRRVGARDGIPTGGEVEALLSDQP